MSILQRIQILASLGEIYHYTSLDQAFDILKQGRFKLSTNVGTKSDQGTAPYFLSMTRSKIGHYHSGSQQGVVLVIDPDYLMSYGKLGPVDYWGREWRQMKPDQNEMEERLWSKKQFVPLPKQANKLIIGMHVLQDLKSSWGNEFHFQARQLWLLAKLKHIKFYFYNDAKAWLLQRTDKAISLEQARSQLTGPQKFSAGKRTNWLKPYLELYYAKDKSKLSKSAMRIWEDASYHYRQPDAINSLEANMHNMRSDERVGKLVELINKHGGNKGFIEYLGKKFQ